MDYGLVEPPKIYKNSLYFALNGTTHTLGSNKTYPSHKFSLPRGDLDKMIRLIIKEDFFNSYIHQNYINNMIQYKLDGLNVSSERESS